MYFIDGDHFCFQALSTEMMCSKQTDRLHPTGISGPRSPFVEQSLLQPQDGSHLCPKPCPWMGSTSDKADAEFSLSAESVCSFSSLNLSLPAPDSVLVKITLGLQELGPALPLLVGSE